MERTVILLFPSHEVRSHFVTALALTDYTLHQKKPILYCRLTKENIELAKKSYEAKDISYSDVENNFTTGLSDALDALLR